MTGDGGSAVLLAELERSNLFLTPLDTHREWFHYHHLFGELLLGELQRVDPSSSPSCTGGRPGGTWPPAR